MTRDGAMAREYAMALRATLKNRRRLSCILSGELAQRPAEENASGGLVVEADVQMFYRPASDLPWLQDRFAEKWGRQAVDTFVRRQPDQLAIPLHENVLRSAAPP